MNHGVEDFGSTMKCKKGCNGAFFKLLPTVAYISSSKRAFGQVNIDQEISEKSLIF